MITKLIKNFITLITAAFILLMVFSYMEILIKNVNPDPIYSNWNIIVNICSM